jgi:uncharacterized protein (UPF0332 family)
MTGDNRRANVAQELSAARRHRQAAERVAAIGEHETAVNRLYYAVLHAARAVCLTEGLEPKSHRGLKHLVVLHFVSAGKLPGWVQSALGQLETERDLADYVADFTVTAERYEERRATADRLLGELEDYLRAQGWM